ncbi:proteasome assembly chaperone family protein [Candidatus Bathyarchaeota archaeon]|nr:proteasome assembly chaperone family protein [Candidatus Bathyarchaeota archaeon]
MSGEEVRVIEYRDVPEGIRIVCGLPDIGLVGVIATAHIIYKLKLKEVAYVDADLLPPIVILENGLPKSPIRIFGNKDLFVLSSEIAIPSNIINLIVKGIIDWVWKKKAEKVLTLGGIPVPNRHEIEKLRIFGAASDETTLKKLVENEIEILQRGFLVGPQALILKYCAERSIPAMALLAEAFYNYPDPEASSVVIQALNKIMNMNIDVSELIEKGEEVRLAMRDMMRRTQTELMRMRKSQEYDVPGFYIR